MNTDIVTVLIFNSEFFIGKHESQQNTAKNLQMASWPHIMYISVALIKTEERENMQFRISVSVFLQFLQSACVTPGKALRQKDNKTDETLCRYLLFQF